MPAFFPFVKTRRWTFLSFLAAVIVFSGAYARHFFSTHPFSPASTTVRIAQPDYLSFALVRIAEHEGFFRRRGLNVEFVRTVSGRDALDQMLAGKADFACSAGVPIANALNEGQDILILSGLATADGAHMIMAPREKSIRGPFDLQGKTVAVPARTSSDFFLDRFLDYHGVPRQSIRRVHVDLNELPHVFERGKADAVCTFKPWEMPGAAYVRLGGDGIYSWTSFLIGRRATADQQANNIDKLLRALLDAETYAIHHRDDLPATLALYYDMDTREFASIWSSLRIGVTIDHAMLRGLEDEVRWVSEKNPSTTARQPDLLNYFYFKGLSRIEPDAVTIVHNADAP